MSNARTDLTTRWLHPAQYPPPPPRPGSLRDRTAHTPDVPADQLAAARGKRCHCGRKVSTLPGGDGVHCAEHD